MNGAFVNVEYMDGRKEQLVFSSILTAAAYYEEHVDEIKSFVAHQEGDVEQ